MSDLPKLYGTPRSHFTRIVRILAHELGLQIEEIDVGNVADATAFGGSPLMQVPVWHHRDVRVWGSDNVCRTLVAQQGADPLGIETLDWQERNVVAVVHGVMAAEVRLVLAARGGIAPVGGPFDKAKQVITRGIAWLEGAIPEEPALTYPTVCAVAMWDHLLLYGNARGSDAPRLDRALAHLGTYASVARTRPV